MDVITTHINADFDCLGGMIAAKKLYPEAVMVFPGSQEANLRAFFVKSAGYHYDFRRLKDIDRAAIKRLILVDVRHSERIGPFAEVVRRDGVELHIFDHHPDGAADLHGDLEFIDPVGSTVTLFCRLFRERGIAPDPEEATMMMLGLYEDTGGLRFSSTTVADFEAAAFLRTYEANLQVVSDCLQQELSASQVALLHELLESRTVLNVNGIDISIVQASVGHFVDDLAVLVHKLRDMEELDVILAAVRMEERIFLVGRSRLPEVSVGEILGAFGGGGHAYAASARVRNLTLIELLEDLPTVLQKQVQPRWQARHLMSYPVKSVNAETPISQVRETLTRYNINAVAVLLGESLVGILTRQTVERAGQHGLNTVAAQEFMTTEFVTVSPEAGVNELKPLVLDGQQRFVPVIDQGHLVGAVTRTDLLRHMVSVGRVLPRTSAVADIAASGYGLKKRHILRRLREQLPQKIYRLLGQLGEVADELEMEIYAVGGFVRDLLLRQENLDIDVVVEGDGIAFAKAFAARHGGRVRAHQAFATAVLILPDDFKIDVATTRMEYYLQPGALPTVEQASIKLDLYRRDFTINTLALSLNRSNFGTLHDYFGAQRDLKDKVLRVLHNLSFVEDSTRAFRAVRFEQRLGFHLGQQTEQLLHSAVRMGFAASVGGARVFNELKLVLQESDPLSAVQRLNELGLLQVVSPSLHVTSLLRPLFHEAHRGLNWLQLLYTGEECQRWPLYFMLLTQSLDKEAMRDLCRLFILPRRRAQMFTEERWAGEQILFQLEQQLRRHRTINDSDLDRWLEPLSTDVALYLLSITKQEQARQAISHYFTHLRATKTFLDGNDLKELGLRPGPVFKMILRDLRDAQLNGKVLSVEAAKAFVLDSASEV